MRGDVEPSLSFEQRFRTKSGDWVWVEGVAEGAARRRTAGRSAWSPSCATSPRAAPPQAALAESEARYRLLADLATDIIMRMDAGGIIRYISPVLPPARLRGRGDDRPLGIRLPAPRRTRMAQDRSEALFKRRARPARRRPRVPRRSPRTAAVVWLEGVSALSRNDGRRADRRRLATCATSPSAARSRTSCAASAPRPRRPRWPSPSSWPT